MTSKISPKTQEVLDALEQDDGKYGISATTYTWAFRRRANVAAAFWIAKARGIIVVDFISVAGTPVYRKA